MKKRFVQFLLLALAIVGGIFLPHQIQAQEDKPVVTVTSSFLQDMVKNIAGDSVQIELIIPAGEDPHLYVAKAQDTDKIAKADLVLYHGLHFEGKMAEILEATGVAAAKDFDEDSIGRMDEDGTMVEDPHFWFDIDLYKQATLTVAASLSEKFPDNAEMYNENAQNYLKELDELDTWIRDTLAQIPEGSRYLVTPHDAFNYFARRYQFEVVAPQGVSTDSEVSNQGIQTTAQFILEHNIPAIFAESTTNPDRMRKLQEAVAAEGGEVEVVSGEGKELFSDSLAAEGNDGDTYITMYKHNIQLIVDHLKK